MRKIIIDCDPGIDDSLAIMLALASKDIEVVGITIVAGNCPVEMGFENTKKILKHMNRLDIPVYKGASKPLKREYINALDTHGKDGLGESFLETVEGYEQEEDAATFISRKLKEETCSIIAIGPLTNIANVILQDKDALSYVDAFISMGGTYKAHGNCSPVAEYNYWCDPDSAKLVYQYMHDMHKKIHMVGLDVTRQIVLTPELLDYMEEIDARQGAFVRAITKFYYTFHLEWEHLHGCVINDPLAIAYFMQPDICKGFDSFVDIETGGISIGQSVVDAFHFYQKESNAHVLTEVDKEAFFTLFFKALCDYDFQHLDTLHILVNKEVQYEN